MMLKKIGDKMTKKSISKIFKFVFTPMTALLIVLAISLAGIINIYNTQTTYALTACPQAPDGSSQNHDSTNQCITCPNNLVPYLADCDVKPAKFNQLSIKDQTYSWVYYNAFMYCSYVDSGNYDIKEPIGFSIQNALAGQFFSKEPGNSTFKDPRIGNFLGRADSSSPCSDTNWIKDALRIWGYEGATAGVDFLCDAGMIRVDHEFKPVANCRAGDMTDSIGFDRNAEAKQWTQTGYHWAIVNKAYTQSGTVLQPNSQISNSMKYLRSWRTFAYGCSNNSASPGTVTKAIYNTKKTEIGSNPNNSSDHERLINEYAANPSMGDLAYLMGTGKNAYGVAYIFDDAGNLKTEGWSCLNSLEEALSFKAEYNTELGGSTDPLGGTLPGGGSEGTVSPAECSGAGPLGWILCPVIKLLSSAADKAKDFLATNFLEVQPKVLGTTAPDDSAYQVWQSVRTVSNVVFVLFFLIIIFSQITGTGVTNYGIKKLLPKLIVAAILVNLSFLICQIAVDLSNITGYSIGKLLDSVLPTTTNFTSIKPSNAFSDITAGVTGAAVGIGLFAMFASTIIPIALGAIVAALMILLLLIGRQALIILLVILSPLAFVAYLLPNTKKLFDTWQKTFTSMLMLFPIVAVVFGASKMASKILSTVWTGTGQNGFIEGIAAAAIGVLPLFVVPGLLKKSMDGVGQIGAKINGLGDKWGKGLGTKYTNSDMAKNFAANKAARIAQTKAGMYEGKNPFRRVKSNLHGALNKNAAFNGAMGGLGSNAILSGLKKAREETAESTKLFDGDATLAQAWSDTGGDMEEMLHGKIDPATGLRTNIPWKDSKGNALDQRQIDKFKLMNNGGQHKKASSFLAASSAIAAKGAGSMKDVQKATEQARARGATNQQLAESWDDLQSAYTTSGRGDMAGEIEATMGLNQGLAPSSPAGYIQRDASGAVSDTRLINPATGKNSLVEAQNKNWGKVTASSIPAAGVEDSSYDTWLKNPDNLRKAVRGVESMRGDSIATAKAKILAAAPGGFTSIDDLKKSLGITTTSS